MPEGSDDNVPMLGGTQDPSRYQSLQARQRFAVSKFYGMGSDGRWKVADIAEELDVSVRTVRRYLNESDIAKETREVLATTDAEWRLDMALQLRAEVEDINETLRELKQRKKAVATEFETKTVEGTPTGDRNIRLPDDADTYRLKMPVPTDFETVTDYGQDIQNLQAEKRRYLKQIADLLGLNDDDQRAVDETLVGQADEVKIVEFRETDDEYPEADPIDMADGDPDDVIDVESSTDAEEAPDDA